jgi:hypothetical protein
VPTATPVASITEAELPECSVELLSIEYPKAVDAFPLHPPLWAATVMEEESPVAPLAGLVTVMPEPLDAVDVAAEVDALVADPSPTVNVVLTTGHAIPFTQDL